MSASHQEDKDRSRLRESSCARKSSTGYATRRGRVCTLTGQKWLSRETDREKARDERNAMHRRAMRGVALRRDAKRPSRRKRKKTRELGKSHTFAAPLVPSRAR